MLNLIQGIREEKTRSSTGGGGWLVSTLLLSGPAVIGRDLSARFCAMLLMLASVSIVAASLVRLFFSSGEAVEEVRDGGFRRSSPPAPPFLPFVGVEVGRAGKSPAAAFPGKIWEIFG